MSDTVHDLSTAPAEGQRITHNNVVYTTIKEGLAYILVPEDSAKDGQTAQQVFYNPIQQFNRDLTILAMNAYGKDRIEQKQTASIARAGKIEKKRKRRGPAQNEQPQPERPTKSAKLDDGTQSADVQADAAKPDVPEEQEPETAAEGENHPEGTDGARPDAEAATEIHAEADTEVLVSDGAAAKNEPKTSFTILDALSASGLRALRYAHEIPFASSITANDILKTAAQAIERNAIHNRVPDKIKVSVDDATAHMYDVLVKDLRRTTLGRNKTGPSEKYDIIDLDPYGSAAPFLDAAVQAVRDDGGLLCVTCTDSGIWASNGYPEKCYSLYGGIPIKGWYSHEVGIRLILHAIETSAGRYGLAMEPLLSLSVDFYSRVFVRLWKSPSMVKFQGGKNMIVYSCGMGCGAWTTQFLMKNKEAPNKKGDGTFFKHGFTRAPTAGTSCEHCGSVMHLAGPMYAGRIHSPEFVKKVISEAEAASPEVYGTRERIRGMLQTALEEFIPSREEMEAESKEAGDQSKKIKKTFTEAQVAAVDPYPFYFHPAHVSGTLHCASPPENALRGALIGLGYRVTRSHCKPGSMKTDAPWSIIWHVFREWVRQKAPVKEENIKPGSVAYRLLGLGKKAEEAAPETQNGGEGSNITEAQGATKEASECLKDGHETLKEVVFDEQLGRHQERKKYVRYQMNPRENWGPMNRAKGK